MQTGFTPYHTDNLFQFTRTPQPTHINPSYYRSVNPKFTRTPQPHIANWVYHLSHRQFVPIYQDPIAHTCKSANQTCVIYLTKNRLVPKRSTQLRAEAANMADYSRNAHMHVNALHRSLILVLFNVTHIITLYAYFIHVIPKYSFWTLRVIEQ